ncbi:MAG: hypothetical protein ABIQ52_21415 [Vicinamibacterales bacterium]
MATDTNDDLNDEHTGDVEAEKEQIRGVADEGDDLEDAEDGDDADDEEEEDDENSSTF